MRGEKKWWKVDGIRKKVKKDFKNYKIYLFINRLRNIIINGRFKEKEKMRNKEWGRRIYVRNVKKYEERKVN